jgi:hypothetical protein
MTLLQTWCFVEEGGRGEGLLRQGGPAHEQCSRRHRFQRFSRFDAKRYVSHDSLQTRPSICERQPPQSQRNVATFDCRRPLPRGRSIAIDPRGREFAARTFKATGRFPDSQAGVDPPEHATFPNRRHDVENVIPSQSSGRSFRRNDPGALTLAYRCGGSQGLAWVRAPCSRLASPLGAAWTPVAYGFGHWARTPQEPGRIVTPEKWIGKRTAENRHSQK